MATAASTIQANQIGVQLLFPNMLITTPASASFTGTTVSLTLTDSTGVMETYGPLTIDPVAGAWAAYTTQTGNELSVVGKYQGQLLIQAFGEQLNSQVFTISVLPNLGAL